MCIAKISKDKLSCILMRYIGQCSFDRYVATFRRILSSYFPHRYPNTTFDSNFTPPQPTPIYFFSCLTYDFIFWSLSLPIHIWIFRDQIARPKARGVMEKKN